MVSWRRALGGVGVVVVIAVLSLGNPNVGEFAVLTFSFAGIQVPPTAQHLPDFGELFYSFAPGTFLRNLTGGAFIGMVVAALYEAVSNRVSVS